MTPGVNAVDILKDAARVNQQDPLLQGSLLVFPNYGQLVMTGDIHGNRKNFEKLQRFCDLDKYGARHVILHELIHTELEGPGQRDTSYELLLDAARWKVDFPDQVHFLLSNHELAQLSRNEISKNGRVVTQAFEESVLQAYGAQGPAAVEAIGELIRSYALAGRTANRVFISHSLPNTRDLPAFDETVFSRTPNDTDLASEGSAHALVWGRHHTRQLLDTLREMLDVDYFLCGHQPQEMGYEVLHDRMIILASEHNHGVFLTLDLSKPVTLDSLVRNIRPFAAVA